MKPWWCIACMYCLLAYWNMTCSYILFACQIFNIEIFSSHPLTQPSKDMIRIQSITENEWMNFQFPLFLKRRHDILRVTTLPIQNKCNTNSLKIIKKYNSLNKKYIKFWVTLKYSCGITACYIFTSEYEYD